MMAHLNLTLPKSITIAIQHMPICPSIHKEEDHGPWSFDKKVQGKKIARLNRWQFDDG